MRNTNQSVTPSFVFDDPAYSALALERASEYQNAQPFPHIAIERFLPPALRRRRPHYLPAFVKVVSAPDRSTPAQDTVENLLPADV